VYTIEAIKNIIPARCLQEGEVVVVKHLLLDTRNVLFPDTSIFIALAGARRNGHAYLQEAYNKGVKVFIVDEPTAISLPPNATVLLVDNTLKALQQLAAHHRQQLSCPIIGITGSNGKTIVKEWLYQLLLKKYDIVRSPKSYNSQIGVPLSVWLLQPHHTLAIFEAGISTHNEMQALEKIIHPTIGLLTNIGDAHNEGFENKAHKLHEKLQLFKHAQMLIYCHDNKLIRDGVLQWLQSVNTTTGKTLQLFTWGHLPNSTLQIVSVTSQDAFTHITGVYQQTTIAIDIPFVDNAAIENAISGWCVLLHLGIEMSFIQEQMLRLSAVGMRLELTKGIHNCSIINDSYSADISSLKIAVNFLNQQLQHPTKTIILSDILEAGTSEVVLYQTVAAIVQQQRINKFIGIGIQLTKYKFLFETIPNLATQFYDSVAAFKKEITLLHFQNESILLKGARIFAFEEIMPFLEEKAHQTLLEINLTALQHNLQQFRQLLQPTTKIMAMVKAFSYGSGSYEIANALAFQQVDYLAVAYADEGVALRKSGIQLPIMVMNPEPASFDALIQYALEPVVYAVESCRALQYFLAKNGINHLPIHLEIETGMHRLGVSREDIQQLIQILQTTLFKVQSVFTHLVASEDNLLKDFTEAQAAEFNIACGVLQTVLPYTFIQHIANSAAILHYPHLQLDMVRLGIGLHGIAAVENNSLSLKEVATFKTTISQIKHLRKGDSVGYGRKKIVQKDTTIATVRVGYADGYPRSLSHGVGAMWVKNAFAPIIGSICMDMSMIDITKIPNVAVLDEVIVFGKPLPVKQLAKWAGTIPYEILAGISQRVNRVYFEE
jgi:Alr-MurF fusion protein